MGHALANLLKLRKLRKVTSSIKSKGGGGFLSIVVTCSFSVKLTKNSLRHKYPYRFE